MFASSVKALKEWKRTKRKYEQTGAILFGNKWKLIKRKDPKFWV